MKHLTITAAMLAAALTAAPVTGWGDTTPVGAPASGQTPAPTLKPFVPRKNEPCAAYYVAASIVSDYRFDGFSESDLQPTWQVNLHCYRTDGFYAGTVLTGVNFEDRPRTTLETDFYVGKHVPVAGSDLNLELLEVWFPGQHTGGPSYGFFEPEAELSHRFGKLTLKGLAAWSPNYSSDTGVSWHEQAGAEFALTDWLSLSGRYGRISIERGYARNHFDVGATAKWRALSFDVRYGGTDLKKPQCYYTDWCAPGAAATVTWSRVL
jgi:uncharacterized protein (TIGR02001 family)